MGIFSFNYDKPGKGVDRDAPEKKGFFLYWELIFDRITKHLSLNLFWALTSIIWIAVLFFIAPVSPDWISSVANSLAQQTGSDLQSVEISLSTTLRFLFMSEALLLWGSGVPSAMYAYVTRCFARRDPVWIMSDGFDKIKENFKQGFILSIVDALIIVLASNALNFYYSLYIQTHSTLWLLICTITFMVMVIYTWAHFYIYQLMVTFEGSLFNHIKNSILFAVANLPMNFLCTVITVGISGGLFLVLNPVFAFFVDIIIGPMFFRFMIEFTAARKIKNTVLKEEPKPAAKITYINDGEENE
ncbi:MAG: hypothetical protein PUF72_02500 [Clostridiales bacterium]|nr:hypothetical protein [Clostridiales bacterium]